MSLSLRAPDFTINSLRGGQNDSDPPHVIDDDQTVLALNVEYVNSTLGERRRGCESVDITDSGLDDEAEIVFLGTHLPAGAEVEDTELWALGATEDTSFTLARRNKFGSWSQITPSLDFDTDYPTILRVKSQSLHGKMFLAYKKADGTDRMVVWDGSTLRMAGLKAPESAPTAVQSGSGSMIDDRTYRVRFIEKVGDEIIRRSEPSDELVFVISGTPAVITVTRPAQVNEGETHWELEASSGDGNFYVIATVAIGTTTADDTEENAEDYGLDFPLSEDVGEYSLMESAKYVIAEQDRLILGGAWEDETHGSRISWTPVGNATGFGNDERIPSNTTNFIDLDWQDGGGLTGLSAPLNGSFYAFKHARIYKVQRTGNIRQAYEAHLVSSTRGAIVGSIVNGVDEYGRGCVYFLDPSMGPSRISVSGGLQYMTGILGTWRRANTAAENIVAHGVYYPDKQQIHWWIALDDEDTPTYKVVSQTTEVQSQNEGTKRGWTVADGKIATAWCSTVVPERITLEDTGGTFLSYRPYIGLPCPDCIQRCDVTDLDNDTPYRAHILSKPYILAGLLNKWGAMTGALLAKATDDASVNIKVKFIRDFGKEENAVNTDLLPEGSESIVNKIFDNLRMSQAYAIQLDITDPPLE